VQLVDPTVVVRQGGVRGKGECAARGSARQGGVRGKGECAAEVHLSRGTPCSQGPCSQGLLHSSGARMVLAGTMIQQLQHTCVLVFRHTRTTY
jgi:hypothetical protein